MVNIFKICIYSIRYFVNFLKGKYSTNFLMYALAMFKRLNKLLLLINDHLARPCTKLSQISYLNEFVIIEVRLMRFYKCSI
ncbi:hypothetical protein BpHYR1_032156 [Brachionus plicatilis]|uniref:Uncharacterized protein n=1 Tax=Brachionus plicatilis TaxID=10195 RepID=A0A3M7Q8U3_BRAPC|nr:hypothetical protein BpHYR1_032156 [Brachionus plicatilis]